MSESSLKITAKLDPAVLSALSLIEAIAEERQLRYVMVGATARDLLLHHGYGAQIGRETRDIDLAIEVESWQEFEVLKQRLCECGCVATRTPHRLESEHGIPLDILPFGGLQGGGTTVAWPPDGNPQMSALGFREACDTACRMQIREAPPLEIPVATPPGMVLMKLIAWTERDPTVRQKDAQDIAYLLRTYETIPSVSDLAFSTDELMERFGWDIRLAAACLLGYAAAEICTSETREALEALTTNPEKQNRLCEGMCSGNQQQFDENWQLLDTFLGGFAG